MDYETKSSYLVNVTATDPAINSAFIWVSIKITDVDEEDSVNQLTTNGALVTPCSIASTATASSTRTRQ